MQVMTILADLCTELQRAEHVTTQSWEHYAQNVSASSFAAAVDATQCAIRLHRQLASRLEQLVGKVAVADVPRALPEPQTPSAA